MKVKRNIGVGIVAASAVAVAAIAAASAVGAKSSSGLIQVIQPGVHPYPAGENRGLAAAAKASKLQIQFTQSNWDPAKDIASVQDAITKGAKAIVIQPNSSEAIVPAIKAADNAGICTIALLTNPGGNGAKVFPGMKAYIGWNEYIGGQTAGRSVVKGLHGKGNVVIIGGDPASSASRDRVNGALSIFKKHPGIHVIGNQPGYYDSQKARNIMSAFVQKFGSKIDAAVVITNNMATAAADVVASSPLKGKVLITSFGGQKQWIDYIRKGKGYSDVPFAPRDEGVAAVRLAKQCMNGNKKPVFLDERTLPALKPLKSEGYVVNAKDAKLFHPQW